MSDSNERKGPAKTGKPAVKPITPPAKPVPPAPVMKARSAQKPVAKALETSALVPVTPEDPAIVADGAASALLAAVTDPTSIVPSAGTEVPAATEQVVAPKAEPVVSAPAAFESVASSQPDPAPAPTSILTKGIFDMATSFDAVATPAAAAQKAQAMMGGLNDRAKAAMEKGTKMGEEMTELTKGNVEAVVASGKIAAKGAESLVQEIVEFNKKNFEATTAMFKSLAAVKSPTELFQVQSEFAKSSFDSMVAETSKMSEALVKLAGEIVQPISNRYAVAAEKMKPVGL